MIIEPLDILKKHLTEDGFYLFKHDDYEKYKEIQVEGNKRKINSVCG